MIKAKQLILLLIFNVFSTIIYAQLYDKELIKEFTPTPNNLALVPIKNIRVNFHLVRNDDGSGNFNEQEARWYLTELLKTANAMLSDNQAMNLPVGNKTPVYPTRLQYSLSGNADKNSDGIYFINDSKLNDFDRSRMETVFSDDIYIKYGIEKRKVLNVFFFENTDSNEIKTGGIGYPTFVKMAACYVNFKKHERGPWFTAGLLNHEIGHSLGLSHSWDGDDCEDTPNNPNCWNVKPDGECKVISNNVMDYNVYQNAYTPCQIAKIHYLMSLDDYESHLFINNDINVLDTSNFIKIGRNDSVIWKGNHNISCNIYLAPKSTLIIKGKIEMAENTKLIQARKSTIILDGGTINYYKSNNSVARYRLNFLGIMRKTSIKSE